MNWRKSCDKLFCIRHGLELHCVCYKLNRLDSISLVSCFAAQWGMLATFPQCHIGQEYPELLKILNAFIKLVGLGIPKWCIMGKFFSCLIQNEIIHQLTGWQLFALLCFRWLVPQNRQLLHPLHTTVRRLHITIQSHIYVYAMNLCRTNFFEVVYSIL